MTIHFDLNQHFERFKNNLFFDQKKYSELRLDLIAYSSLIKNKTSDSAIALKIISPYHTFVALLSCFINHKTAIMISPLETDDQILRLKETLIFNTTLDDDFFKRCSQQKDSTLFPPFDMEYPAMVVMSSGTTAAPKGIALTISNLYYSALGFSQFFKQNETHSSLINLPHHHVGGLMILWRSFFSGGRIVTDLNETIDFISLVPTQLNKMLQGDQQNPKNILKRIQVILIGGAPLNPSLHKLAKDFGLRIFETYGMSETASLVLVNGEVLPYRQVKLDDDGFFHVSGKTLAIGYFQKNKLIPLIQKDQWFKTNDLGEKNEWGQFKFLARADLIFISGGENINPLQIEEVAKRHSQITEAILVPVPDEIWGEMGILLYETKDENHSSFFKEELKVFLKSILHPHHVPKKIFPYHFSKEGDLKPKRSELKKKALDLYTHSLFSYELEEASITKAPLLVLFHGFMGEKSDLQKVSSPLKSHYSILSIDLPGHGKTLAENFTNFSDFFFKLANFIKLFSVTPTYYGYSMGGRIALHLALHYLSPNKLILESAGLGLMNDEEKKVRLKEDLAMFADVQQDKLEDFLIGWYSNPMFKPYTLLSTFNEDCQKKATHDFTQWQKAQAFLSVGAFPQYFVVLNDLNHSNFPIEYITGLKDQKYSQEARLLANLPFKKIQTSVITGAGHNPHKTHPLEITNILLNSLT
jgi:O-succinylbenzoic acid--CoA ligase